eukprot:TRINITY_DN11949_c0_g1_i1.p1 TRINITY_DN11949_c0_g1~~TRINITY_DN11949_c0_g1_i1.p1  ORF type:complete len:575 (+),score=144.13 TRINITY_DN11949_c0_g1_i1:22-1725(+)
MTTTGEFASIPKRLFQQLDQYPDLIRHYERNEERVYVPTTNGEMREELMNFTRAMINLGFEIGDRVAIMGCTQSKWVLTHYAAQSACGIAAGIYKTCAPEQVAYIVNDCTAKFLVLHDQELLDKLGAYVDEMTSVEKVIIMNGPTTHERAITWAEFLTLGGDVEEEVVFERIDNIRPDDCVSLIYTSGTTGPPKGVMLSSRNCEFVGRLLAEDYNELFGVPKESVYVSYLPLSHIAEQVFTIFGPALLIGRTIYYCWDSSELAATLVEVRPHVIFAPPRLWEKFCAGISAKLPEGVTPAQLPDENKRAILTAVGLDRMLLPMTGAAPISPKIVQFFRDLGVPVSEIYGQSEGSGPTTFNIPGKTKVGSAGVPVQEVEVVLAEDNEILFRGPQAFLGYWNLPDKTAETIDSDGFVHSGDLGRFDEDGFLYIVGRKKDIIITSGGKNVTPINMENSLKTHPLIGAAVVVGEGRPYLNALICLDDDVVAALAAKHGITPEQFKASPGCHEAVEKHVEECNQHFNRQEQVKKFKILEEPFSIENDTLTPTTKVKRANVNVYYADVIDALYQ